MDFLQKQKGLFTKEDNKKLRDFVVLVAGCGGLGTNQVTQLQRIGVKKIYLVDYDVIEISNLNRQILYSAEDIGKPKVKIAKEKLDSNTLGTEIISLFNKVDTNFCIPADVDLVLDALDNFKSRLTLETLCLDKNIPFIHGGINGMYGQVTSITNHSRVKLKDLIDPDSNKKINSFLPVIATVASIQVNEAVKIYLEKTSTLTNQIMFIDFEDYSFTILDL